MQHRTTVPGSLLQERLQPRPATSRGSASSTTSAAVHYIAAFCTNGLAREVTAWDTAAYCANGLAREVTDWDTAAYCANGLAREVPACNTAAYCANGLAREVPASDTERFLYERACP